MLNRMIIRLRERIAARVKREEQPCHPDDIYFQARSVWMEAEEDLVLMLRAARPEGTDDMSNERYLGWYTTMTAICGGIQHLRGDSFDAAKFIVDCKT
jgi:hypothetical protein